MAHSGDSYPRSMAIVLTLKAAPDGLGSLEQYLQKIQPMVKTRDLGSYV